MDLLLYNANPQYENDGQYIYEFPNANSLWSKEEAEKVVKEFNIKHQENFVVTAVSALIIELKKNNWTLENMSLSITKFMAICTILYPDIFDLNNPIIFEFIDEKIKFYQGGALDKYLESEMAINN